jgi:solute carrier family 25 protein 34/35
MRHIYLTDGSLGLQAGLRMAVVREASKAFFRIGLFDPLLGQLHDPARGSAPLYKRMLAGMTSGAIAALVCNPIELVKTRQQAGHGGDKFSGPIDGLRKLHASEGVVGMWRGTGVSMIRSAAVTGPHLTTYTGVKDLFVRKGWLNDAPPLHILASLAGGLTGILCNHPIDLIRNRLYDQPVAADGRGLHYTGAVDCARKLVRAEGAAALYRGFMAHYIRVGPHYVITFTILEQLKRILVNDRADQDGPS